MLGWYQSMLQINLACNIDHIILRVIVSGRGPYLVGELEELQQIHNSYIGGGGGSSKEKQDLLGAK